MVLDFEIMNPVQICSSFLLSFITLNAQPKGFLYDESRVSNYELPDPLICLDGTKVVNSKLWIKFGSLKNMKLLRKCSRRFSLAYLKFLVNLFS